MIEVLCLIGIALLIANAASEIIAFYKFKRSWNDWANLLPDMHYLNFDSIHEDEQERFQ